MKPFLEFMNEDTERLRIGDLVKLKSQLMVLSTRK